MEKDIRTTGLLFGSLAWMISQWCKAIPSDGICLNYDRGEDNGKFLTINIFHIVIIIIIIIILFVIIVDGAEQREQ